MVEDQGKIIVILEEAGLLGVVRRRMVVFSAIWSKYLHNHPTQGNTSKRCVAVTPQKNRCLAGIKSDCTIQLCLTKLFVLKQNILSFYTMRRHCTLRQAFIAISRSSPARREPFTLSH